VPELPDIETYLAALRPRIVGQRLEGVRLASPFLLRTVDPPLSELAGRGVIGVSRLGKRIVIELEGEAFLVLHLMIAGRLAWAAPGGRIPARVGLAAFDFASGSLVLTEASKKRRASLHAVRGREALRAHDPGGIEPLACDFEAFDAALRRERHTVKRALTDPRLLSGIGNAYSDEILHRARLSPFASTDRLDEATSRRLFEATGAVLGEWTRRLAEQTGEGFPEKVTAFRPEMAVHGRAGEPCPVCGAPVQRIAYADRETNYCARCQTGGRLLSDRALARLLKDDFPRTLDELEALRSARRPS